MALRFPFLHLNYKLKEIFVQSLSRCFINNSKYFHENTKNDVNVTNFFFHSSCTSKTVQEITSDFIVIKEFLSEDEELLLSNEVEPYLKRMRYQFDHWDDAIHGYRETERNKWSSKSTLLLKKVKQTSFGTENELIPQVHVLDLDPNGVIKPHVDSVRFCGRIISGLSLLSDALMRLVKEESKEQIVDVLLPRRSLYIMRDASRYHYTHEILSQESSYFGEKLIERQRRISIICRSPP